MQQVGRDFIMEFSKMVLKRLLVLYFMLVVFEVSVMSNEVIIGNPIIKLINKSERTNVNIEMTICNDSEASIIIPKVFFTLFEGKKIIGDWIIIKNKKGVIFSHNTIFKNIVLKYQVTNNANDLVELKENSLILEPNQSYSIEYDNIQKYFRIPFWIKTVYIQYKGPLGESNVLEIKL